MNFFFNVISPLDLFEILSLVSIHAPVFGNISLGIINTISYCQVDASITIDLLHEIYKVSTHLYLDFKSSIPSFSGFHIRADYFLSTFKPMYENINFSNGWLYYNLINKSHICYDLSSALYTKDYIFIPRINSFNYLDNLYMIIYTFLLKFKFIYLMLGAFFCRNVGNSNSNVIVCKRDYYENYVSSTASYSEYFASILTASYYMYIYLLGLLIVLLALIGFNLFNLITLLFILISLSYTSINKHLIYMIVFFSLFTTVNSQLSANTLHKVYLIIFLIGNLMYIGLLSLYDYLSISSKVRNKCITRNKYLNGSILGLLYLFAIITGIFASNCLYYLTANTNDGPLWFIVSSILAILAAGLWDTLQGWSVDNINPYDKDYHYSIIRSIIEAVSFNSVCWSTYYSWNALVALNLPSLNVWAGVIGFLSSTFCGYHVIRIESQKKTTYDKSYGVLYLLWFTSLAFSTNGIIGIITPYLEGSVYSWILGIFSGILIIILAPDFYRSVGTLINLLLLLEALKYYLLFFSYASLGWLLYWPLLL